MYKLLLILRYLRKRRIAWASLFAVTLCTMMVIIIISVMGGWLRMFRESFHGLSGDILVSGYNHGMAGFADYDRMIAEVRKLPEVSMAVPTIHTGGVLKIAEDDPKLVQVLGYPIQTIGQVNDFPQSLYLQHQAFVDTAEDSNTPKYQRAKYLKWAEQGAAHPSFSLRREVAVPLESLPALKLPPGLALSERGHRAWFDEDALRLCYSGVMSEAEKAALLKLPSAKAGGDGEAGDQVKAYADAVEELYRRSQKPPEPPQPFRPPEDAWVNLRAGLPEGVKLPMIPRDGMVYDSARKLLIYRGRPSGGSELADWHNATDDTHFREAVERLFDYAYDCNTDYYSDQYLTGREKNLTRWPGMIISVGILGIPKGPNQPRNPRMYTAPTKLTVVGTTPSASLSLEDKSERSYFIVDDSRTKAWQYDNNTVYVPFDVIQQDLRMDARKETYGEKEIIRPARASELYIKVKEGADLNKTKDKVEAVVWRVCEESAKRMQAEGLTPRDVQKYLGFTAGHDKHLDRPLEVQTWEDVNAMWLGAIEKEKVLVLFLFGIVSLVSIFLIFCIFYMIVAEKTRDIGIIKSVGATNAGVAGIFLGYGMVIGVLGAGMGLLFGWLIVHNINWLHTKMGELLHVQIWDPKVYQFETIPNTMDPREVSVIVVAAIISAVLGALVPAIRAARLHPVEALRWE